MTLTEAIQHVVVGEYCAVRRPGIADLVVTVFGDESLHLASENDIMTHLLDGQKLDDRPFNVQYSDLTRDDWEPCIRRRSLQDVVDYLCLLRDKSTKPDSSLLLQMAIIAIRRGREHD